MSSYPGIPPGWIVFNLEEPHPEPLSVIAGDSVQWSRTFEQYPASAGWTLQYVLNSPTARYIVASGDITVDAGDGNGFQIQIPGAETKGWQPGKYLWLAVMTNAGLNERQTCALGRIVVQPDILDASVAIDTREPEEVALENIRAMLAGVAQRGEQEYKINGRELRRYSVTELLQLKAHFTSEVRRIRQKRGEYQEPDTVAFHAGWGING